MASTRPDGIIANPGPPRRRVVMSVVMAALPATHPPAATDAAETTEAAEATAVAGPSSPQRAVIGATGVPAPA